MLLAALDRESHPEKRLLILDDLIWRCRRLPNETRFFIEREALRRFTMLGISERVTDAAREAVAPRTPIDVAIIVPKEVELTSAQVALGITPGAREQDRFRGYRFWQTTWPTSAQGAELSVLLTMIGEEGNVACANACDHLLSGYDVGLCLLIGIAAGVKDRVQLGDVVAPQLVLDYEHQRLEQGGPRKRPRPYPLETEIGRDLQYFAPARRGWTEFLSEASSRLKEHAAKAIPRKATTRDWSPTFHHGVLLSGEKLIADGSLAIMPDEYHERTRAADQEGAGFARSCRDAGVPWLIFRGVSDFGDPSKKKTWQPLSALTAAIAALTFLQHEYRKPDVRF